MPSATKAAQVTWFYSVQHKINGHRASTTNFAETGATLHNVKTPQVHQLKWTSPISSKFVMDAGSASIGSRPPSGPGPKT